MADSATALRKRTDIGELSSSWKYREGQRETRRAVLSTLFLFGLITWLYEVTVRIAIPWWLSEPLNHINLFPFNLRVDLMGMVAFVVSAPAFFLQLTREREKNDCETSMY